MILSINMSSCASVRSEEAITYWQVRNETFMGHMRQMGAERKDFRAAARFTGEVTGDNSTRRRKPFE